ACRSAACRHPGTPSVVTPPERLDESGRPRRAERACERSAPPSEGGGGALIAHRGALADLILQSAAARFTANRLKTKKASRRRPIRYEAAFDPLEIEALLLHPL